MQGTCAGVYSGCLAWLDSAVLPAGIWKSVQGNIQQHFLNHHYCPLLLCILTREQWSIFISLFLFLNHLFLNNVSVNYTLSFAWYTHAFSWVCSWRRKQKAQPSISNWWLLSYLLFFPFVWRAGGQRQTFKLNRICYNLTFFKIKC